MLPWPAVRPPFASPSPPPLSHLLGQRQRAVEAAAHDLGEEGKGEEGGGEEGVGAGLDPLGGGGEEQVCGEAELPGGGEQDPGDVHRLDWLAMI